MKTVLAIAEALRDEFGIEIDAHPGGKDVEAGAVNRAFRAAAKVVIGGFVPTVDDVGLILSRVLRQVALGRLIDVGIEARRAEEVLDSEPGLGDRWLAYLALAPRSVIGDLLDAG